MLSHLASWQKKSPLPHGTSLRRGVVVWPNPRLQRTPLRAPLSRKPLGGIKTLAGVLFAFGACVVGVSVSVAQTLSSQQGWLRSSIKELDEPDRSIFLHFLEDGRKRSDAVAASLVSGNRVSLEAQIAPAAISRWEQAVRAIRELKASGVKSELTYRNQAMEIRTEVGKRMLTSRVWYLVGDPRADPPRNFLALVVNEEAGHAGKVIVIEPLSYAGDVPSWLLEVDGPVLRPSPRAPK
jgi:hypothetical protein